SRLFKTATIKTFTAYFNRIVLGLLENPGLKPWEIDILTPEERESILFRFNGTATPYPSELTVWQLFKQQAEETPHRVAVVFDKKTLSYGELERRAADLGHHLRRAGVGTGSIVAVMTDKSLEMTVALLAVLNAGGAYLPISPDYPEERKTYMLKDSRAFVCLTLEKFRHRIPADITVFSIDNPVDTTSIEPSHVGRAPLHGTDDLVYVLYTSGSTGLPKGVMVRQRNVVRLVKNTNYVEFNPGQRLLQTGALEFDASTFEIWGALLNGLSLYLEPREHILDPDRFKSILVKYDIRTIWLTAPFFNQLSQEDVEIFASLKNLLVGGDVLSPHHIRRVKEQYPDLRIINGYGPTENTTFSTTYLIPQQFGESIPIGSPIANSTCYILGPQNAILPVGVAGELMVGGDGVSRGYLNNVELTMERFIPSPFVPGERLYRTGDLAFWMPDGNIHFIGRIDQQVKIRGFRIEPGEIENRLLEQNAVKEAFVMSRSDEAGEKFLCAYIVPLEGTPESPEMDIAADIRGRLSQLLPAYMVPSYFIVMQYLPLTANGKIDRRALPLPEVTAAPGGYVPPQNHRQQQLVDIWAQLLDLESSRISIDADFFDLGGHSLKATVMVSRIHKLFQVKMSLVDFFENPTIRDISLYIDGASNERFTAIHPVEKKSHYPLAAAQRRLFLFCRMHSQALTYNIPVIVPLPGDYDEARLQEAFTRLVNRHESLRTSFVLLDDQPVQLVADNQDIALEYHTLNEPTVAGREKETLEVVSRFVRPFDLGNAPLLRVGVLEAGKEFTLLMLDIHHIISDGTSQQILLSEAMTLYAGRDLPELKLQYKDYAEWQNSETQRAAAKAQEAYWLREVGEPPLLDLPTDFPRPGTRSFEGDSIDFEIGVHDAAALKKLAADCEATLYMILFALYNVFLTKVGGREDIVVGTAVVGRRHADLEHIIGMFVNMLALRNYPQKEKTFSAFLAEIRLRTLTAFENQDYQYEDLVEKIPGQKDMSRNPLFDVVFSLEQFEFGTQPPEKDSPHKADRAVPGSRDEMDAPGIKNEEGRDFAGDNGKPIGYENKTSKYDLTLMGTETGDTIFLRFEYCSRLFKPQTIALFADYFKEITAAVLENPDITLGKITISHQLVEPKLDIGEEAGGDFVF
ncbi:MAG: amino acid adenylation domain-containing protein, partial [bacterium]|nr:amino acid adenylation domain-containing protein [bacterium]